MFDDLEAAILAEREKIHLQYDWVNKFKTQSTKLKDLGEPWIDNQFIQVVKDYSISEITKIAAVDGGVVSESLIGFDLVLYRAAGVVFTGIGKKIQAKYIPDVDPKPGFFFNYTLESRFDLNRLINLLRLSIEYEVASKVISEAKPTILFLDGKLSPLHSDISQSTELLPVVKEMQNQVKVAHAKMVKAALENQVILCGVVKDSRSREICKSLASQIPNWVRAKKIEGSKIRGWRDLLPQITDTLLTNNLLKLGERLSWFKSEIPNWLSDTNDLELRHTMLKAVSGDFPIRLEVFYSSKYSDFNTGMNICLQSFMTLCKHGLPIAIPTIIQDADSRAKITMIELDSVIDQISILLGIPKEHLKKRRSYTTSLD